MGQQAEKDRKSKRVWQKNTTGDNKVESNDSPEIPDREETSDNLSLPSEVKVQKVLFTCEICNEQHVQ